MRATHTMAGWALGVALAAGAKVAVADEAPTCEQLSAAHKAEPSAGSATALGDCLRKAGKVAGARAAYDEARALARRAADEAERRLREVEEGQPKVVLLAAGGVPAGTSIRLDGMPIDPAAIGTAFPVQPGHHLLEVARGEARWSARVEVEAGTLRVPLPGPDGERVAAEPPAPPMPAPSPAAPAPPPVPVAATATPKGPGIHWEAHRISGVTLGGAGLVALVVGTVFGAQAISKKNASNDGPCSAADYCDATGRALRADAMRAGDVATVALFAGGAAIASGLSIFFTAPSSPVPVGVGAGLGGVRLGGRW